MFDSSTLEAPAAEAAGFPAISFAERMVASDAFRALFREGMALVEATATYLDGDGREQSRLLTRAASLSYATESMRLTTRLMQITSWLLLQRAVNEGELTRSEAEVEHRKVRLVPQEALGSPETLAALPEQLQSLIDQSLRLQERIVRLDMLFSAPDNPQPAANPVAAQLDSLQQALLAGRR
jgi:regulator of CtrA degradation